MNSVAITDHGNMYGAIEFYKEAKKNGIKPIIGCEIYVAAKGMEEKNKDNTIHHLILLAKDDTGYKNLMKLVSIANLRGFYRKPRIDYELLEKHCTGLVCLSGCLSGEVSSALKEDDHEKAKAVALKYHSLFGDDYYIELQKHKNNEDQNKVTPMLIKFARELNIKMVATADCHYMNKEDNPIHDVLLAIQTRRMVDDPNRMTTREDDFSVIPPEEMVELFYDAPEAVANTQEIADKCNLEIDLGTIHMPEYETEDADLELALICVLGLREMELEEEPGYRERLDYELDIIKKTGFATYLLIVADIIQWAKENSIAVGPGRGSAAGSLICYASGITTIDPLKYGLLFERFMNPDRISMPDIDIDIDEEKRSLVLEYVKKKYGNDSVAQIITFGTMASRMAIRDVGRVLDLSNPLCDKIAKLVPQNMPLVEALEKVNELKQEYETDPDVKKLINTASKLEGVIRHAGTHACGVVIARDKIHTYSPTQLSTRDENVVTTQYNMYSIDALGLLKIDFLGLMNLTIIRKTLELIKERYNTDIDMQNIPLNDKHTFRLLQKAKTTSVFQLESDGMKRHLRQLKPTSINDITAMVALYRPGPMELIPEYIERKHGRHKVKFLYHQLEPILKDTYGIMIYQEQLMAACRELAGLTLAQADILRKAVGKKDEKLLKKQEVIFKEGAERIGTPKDVADRFWALVEPFSRYGFNKSHAVAYAMTAYSTAYLKANYPLEFMTAVLNCDATDIERASLLINETKDIGHDVVGPDVNYSDAGFAIDGSSVRFGLSAIKGVGGEVMNTIIRSRGYGKIFTNLAHFLNSLKDSGNKRIFEALAKCGALDALASRESIVVASEQVVAYHKFKDKELAPELVLPQTKKQPAQRLVWEKELLGFYVSGNPAEEHDALLRKHKAVPIKDIKNYPSDHITIGGVVADLKKTMTRKGTPMLTGSIHDRTGSAAFVVFSRSVEKLQNILLNNNLAIIRGKIDDSVNIKILCNAGKKVGSII